MDLLIDDEIGNVTMDKPHVVILGAGASRATCLDGDKYGNKLPVMNDFSDIVGITSILQEWGIDPNQNFEDIFSTLYENEEAEKISALQNATEAYFKCLTLPDCPTIYDYLILSLREKDIIATFNWDSLLVQAYLRSRKAGLPLPKLLFLHGNVIIGYCEEHKTAGLNGSLCPTCHNPFTPTKLLYPIREKNYSSNQFIASQWEGLQWGLKNAFMITIFGYSGPKTDKEAISLMKNAWGDINTRSLEQTCFITIDSKEKTAENWNEFIHTHHYEIQDSFYDSWIAQHPRRTGEAYLSQYIDANFIENNPIPQNQSLLELWRWYGQFIDAEEEKHNNKL